MQIFLASCLTLLTISFQDDAKKTPPSVAPFKYLLVDAGKADETGWFPAQSTHDGFSVKMPGKFHEYTGTFPNVDGNHFTMTFLKTEVKNIKYIVISTRMLSGTWKNNPLDNSKFESEGKLFDKKEVKLVDLKGMEFRFQNSRNHAYVRKLANEKVLFQILVEAPATSKFAEVEKDARRFMDSFALLEAKKSKD